MSTAEAIDERTRDAVTPGQRWEFDTSVASCFDDMLARSIPQYDVMRSACFDLGREFIRPDTHVLDLGCSRGEALFPFLRAFKSQPVKFLGVEVSPAMREAAQERFKDHDAVEIRDTDLRLDYPDVTASLTLCVLTLQFTPIEYRQQILRRVYQHTAPGGALLLVEKTLGASADIDAQQVARYYDLKQRNGYTREQIDRKRLSLEGVLVPVTARWNEELLKGAGFTQVDCFWRWMNFAGWIAIRD